LTVLFFNAQSLCGKLADLHDFVYSRPNVPIVVGVVETWLNNVMPDCCINVPGFVILRFDRPTHGGGIMLLVKENYNIVDSKCLTFGSIQVLYADIECELSVNNVVRFVCVYRPPNSDMTSSLSFLKALESNIAPFNCNKPVIVMGDFNLTKIDWSVPCPTVNHTTADVKLILFSQRSGFKQVVTLPTHDHNITDLVFVSHDNLIVSVDVDIPFSTSDHSSIEFQMVNNTPKAGTCTHDSLNCSTLPAVDKLDFDNIDHAGFAAELLHTDWPSIFSEDFSIDYAWEQFSKRIMSLVAKFTPIKVSFIPSGNTRFPFDIQRLIRMKKASWSTYKKFRRESDKKIFRNLAKLVRNRINTFRKEREERILRSASVKKFYAYVAEHMNVTSHMGPLRDHHGKPIISDFDKAEAFNHFFHSVFTIDDNNMPDFTRRTAANMDMPVFAPEEVRAVLLEAKNSNACGPDGCSSKFLKFFPELCVPLCKLFNMSMRQQAVPQAWKLANVVPIYKGKGSKLDVTNYRPISLTNVFCKLMEKLVRKRIVKYLDTNELISVSQSGFRSGRSTLSQLLLSHFKLIDGVNNRSCIDGVYTDLSKAFDSISHKKLLLKLHAYGVNLNVCKWIEHFLSDRRQRVIINDCVSGWLGCTSGVPQGSVLGPILFLVYINDLPDCVKYSDIFLYADDAKILKCINCMLDCIHFQIDIDAIVAWCVSWQLKLNVSKCLFIRYGLVDRPLLDYMMSGALLKKVDVTNDLGVMFDTKLSFSTHCNSVANKGFMRANMLLKCFHTRDYDLQIKLFNTFVRPVLEYNSPVWSPHLVKDIAIIERVQKYFTKNLRGLRKIPYLQRLTILGQPTLQSRRTRADLIYLFKILNGYVDNNLKKFFVQSLNVSTCEMTLRGHANKLFIPKPRTDLIKFNFVYRVSKCWNSLPSLVCDTNSLAIFKSRLADYLMHNNV
jgi:exonuclease III